MLIQTENPQAGQGAPIDKNVAEDLVQAMLGPVPERPASPGDQVFDDIEEYMGSLNRDTEAGEGSGVQDKGKEVDEGQPSKLGNDDDTDEESDSDTRLH